MTTSNYNPLVKVLNNWILSLFIILTIVVTLLSITSYFFRDNIYLELTTNFKHQYLVLGALPLSYFALTRRKRWLIVTLFCLLINLTEIIPWYIPKLSFGASGEPMGLFLFNVSFSNTQYGDAIALVKEEKPTIAAFLEAKDPWPKQLEALREVLPYNISIPELQIEVYSRLPLQESEILEYGKSRGLVKLDLSIAGADASVIVTHSYPQFYFGKQEDFGNQGDFGKQGDLEKQGWQWRNQDLEEEIGDYIRQIEKPVVLIGDLNVTMWSPYYKSLIESSGLRDARAGFGILPTLSKFSPANPWLAIPVDHCLVSRDVKVIKMRTGPDLGSDHLPVITDIALRASQKSEVRSQKSEVRSQKLEVRS
ncbi:endonuclease/exonuclease/phosphatase family protein [Moorena sp. SIO3B2]|uniref:endonuclease/exonuclease/phosphatase family protein n=1 Tax=Moorena sp. SIO3B2 TaxID=2607827 RepID=UPI0013C653BD|nr:endonuclease/exonuclease/phosphatase family protein [Moorena sp. SIO3B2]NEP32730.1 endonuclease/exonuclease/phosphatase family protein [Moorena sp. SIO3B2]